MTPFQQEAAIVHEAYLAYREAGFSNKQAMALVIAVLVNSKEG